MTANGKALLVHCSWGSEDPERATVAFIVASTASAANRDTAVFLSAEGVRIATKRYADTIRKEGHKPLKEFLQSFLGSNGKLWVCGACANARQITKEDLIEGAAITGAMSLVDHVDKGAAVVI